MCFRNGSKTFKNAPDRRYASLRVHQMGHPSGTVSASKCITHSEPFLLPNVYPIWNASRRIMSTQNHHPATRPLTLSPGKLHPSPDFSVTSTRPRMSLHHAPNVSPIWSAKPSQMCYSFGAQNDSKSASEMEAKPSKARLTGVTQI